MLIQCDSVLYRTHLMYLLKYKIIIMFQNESVQSKTLEISNLRDKITSLEASLTSITEEKTQNEVTIAKMIYMTASNGDHGND